MHNFRSFAWSALVCFGLQAVCLSSLSAGTDGYLTPGEQRKAQEKGFVPTSTSSGNTDINLAKTVLTNENKQVTITISSEDLNRVVADKGRNNRQSVSRAEVPSLNQGNTVLQGSRPETVMMNPDGTTYSSQTKPLDWTNTLRMPDGSSIPNFVLNNGKANTLAVNDPAGHSWAQDTVNGFGQWVSDTVSGLQDGGWKKDPLGYFLSWTSDTIERSQEFSSDTFNHNQAVKSPAQARIDSEIKQGITDILWDYLQFRINESRGQGNVELGERMINQFSQTYPRQDVINALHEIGYMNLDRFGGRYADATVLRSLVNNKLDKTQDSRPLAVVIYPLDDWNGGFLNNAKGFNDLVAHGYKIDYYQVATDVEAIDAIKKATDNGANPASLILIGGHGDQGSVEFGTPFMFGVGMFNLADEPVLKSLRPSLIDGGTIVFASCSVGKGGEQEDNMVNLFSRVFPQASKVIGATIPVGRLTFEIGTETDILGVTYATDHSVTDGTIVYDARRYQNQLKVSQ